MIFPLMSKPQLSVLSVTSNLSNPTVRLGKQWLETNITATVCNERATHFGSVKDGGTSSAITLIFNFDASRC